MVFGIGLILVASFVAAGIIASGIPQKWVWILTGKYSMKPFTCTRCLSFWICLALSIYNNGDLLFIVSAPLISMYIGAYLEKQLI